MYEWVVYRDSFITETYSYMRIQRLHACDLSWVDSSCSVVYRVWVILWYYPWLVCPHTLRLIMSRLIILWVSEYDSYSVDYRLCSRSDRLILCMYEWVSVMNDCSNPHCNTHCNYRDYTSRLQSRMYEVSVVARMNKSLLWTSLCRRLIHTCQSYISFIHFIHIFRAYCDMAQPRSACQLKCDHSETHSYISFIHLIHRSHS